MDRLEEYLKNYVKKYTPYKGGQWCYEDGCVLKGCADLYEAGGDPFYLDFVLDFLDRAVDADGTIPRYETEQYNIDSINTGKMLFFALDQTGKKKYEQAIFFHMQRLNEHPRCGSGNFWHKTLYPNQVWLDGLYMAQPFYAEYAARYGTKEQVQDIVRQFAFVREHMFNPEKVLYYHGCDTSKLQPWADRETGCSANFWLRSMGWYLMALADCIDKLGGEPYLEELFCEAVQGILPYADNQTGLFYQVIDRADAPGNYLETSGSAMVGYALLKGTRLGLIGQREAGLRIVSSLTDEKLKEDGQGILRLTDICAVAGLGPGEKRDGSVAYYLSEPKKDDDAKGVGPFMMAVGEAKRC